MDISGYYYLYVPQTVFILLSMGSMFLFPLFISGKCTRKKYIITLLIINAAEIAVVLYLFSRFQRDVSANFRYWDRSNDVARIQTLYIVFFIWNNIITIKRCNALGLKKYNYIIPGLQFIKMTVFISCVFIFMNKLEMAGFLALSEGALVWVPLIAFIVMTNGIQIAYLQKGKNDAAMNLPPGDKIIKYTTVCLVVIETMFAVSAVVTFGYYDFFWEINDYVFAWMWLDGLAGIVLFVFGMCRAERITFKKDWLMILAIPLFSSFVGFIGVGMSILHPSYGIGLQILRTLCHIIGFPLMIIFALQDRYRVNKLLIGTMALLTPLARLVVVFNIWIR